MPVRLQGPPLAGDLEGERLWLRACWAYLDPDRIRTEPTDYRRWAKSRLDLEAAGITPPDVTP